MLTKIILIILSLILIGFLANLSGKLAEKLKLPSLIGMILIGMIIGPSFLNLVPKATLNIAPTLKDIALVTVLFIGGLGISLKQMKQMKKLGAFEDILKLIPGVGNQLKDINIDPKQMARVEAIIYSMTEQERKNPDLINASRKNRIAKGCGCDIAEVNRLIKQFTDMRKMMKKFSNMDPRQMERMAAAMQRGGGNPMAGLGGMMGQGKKGKGKGRGGFRF